MKKILFSVTLVIVVLIATLVIRTLIWLPRISSGPLSPVSIEVDAQQVARRLSRAIQIPTISHQTRERFDRQAFLDFQAFLRRSYPYVHGMLSREVISDYSLLYTWKGKDTGKKAILLMAHVDVVPPGANSDWTYPPFEGRIAEGYIWGRGAIDDKGAVISILEAVEMLLRDGFQPRRTIYIAFGHDEEIGGYSGALKINFLLRARDVRVSYVLDEGLVITDGVLPVVSVPVALIGIGEKGNMSLELSATGEGGHSSMPPKNTAVGILSRAVARLEEHQLPAKLDGPVRNMFDYLVPEMSFAQRLVFANLWLFGPLVKKQLAASRATNAMIRTTAAVTMFQGGDKENVLPVHARAIVNFRLLPGDSIDSVVGHVRKIIDDPQVQIRRMQSFSEPPPISDIDSPGYESIQQTIRQVFPGVVIAPSLLIGATDSKHYVELSENVYRFRPIWIRPEDLSRYHGADERVSVENLEKSVQFYYQLIKNSEAQ
ncbi:MAG: M20 family peptidase [Candidatus Tectomicrobia bacterium]